MNLKVTHISKQAFDNIIMKAEGEGIKATFNVSDVALIDGLSAGDDLAFADASPKQKPAAKTAKKKK